VVVIFDENIYTLSPLLERISYTGTELREVLVKVPVLQDALDDGSLVFVANSTSTVQDVTLHFAYRKGKHIPRRLLAELFPSTAKQK